MRGKHEIPQRPNRRMGVLARLGAFKSRDGRDGHPTIGLLILLTLAGTIPVHPEEIWLHNNDRVYGLVQAVTPDGKLGVLLPTGEKKHIPLQEIIAIRFLGRSPLLIQSGTQEFQFVNGGRLRGQIVGNHSDNLKVQTAFSGLIDLNLSHLKGFVGLPLIGFTGRKAEELVEGERGRQSRYMDVVLDRRGSTVNGVVRKIERTALHLDIDDILQVKPFKVLYLKGVRLADAGRDPHQPWKGDVQIFVWGRDGSVVLGNLSKIHLGRWTLSPVWNPKSPLVIDFNEISLVQVLGGRVQYLSQLSPSQVKEQTILAPPQPYKMDRSCQGDFLSISGKRYPWGIGVHADSEITFDLGARFKEFRADIGIATGMGKRGSVIFSVLGDGKELYKSPVVKGSDSSPREVSVSVQGVKKLALKVTNANDLDLGDVANWGSARVLR